MKIGYFADGPWSHEALKKIVADDRFNITFIVPRYDRQDLELKKWATKLGIDFIPIENVNHQKSIDKLISYEADIFVSMSFNQILKKDILKAPPKGFINCHAGALPFYRGRNILNWVLINDEREFGITVHYIDEGIDTGDIIRQKMLPITDQDDYSTLLSTAIDACAQLLYRSLVDIERNSVKRIKQASIHPVGTYFGRRREGDEWIDWNWTSRQIFNFVRAISLPGPYAQTMLGEQTVLIQRASLISNAPEYIGTPGEIVGRVEDSLIVKTGDSSIKLTKYEIDSAFDIPRNTSKPKIAIGNRFSINLSAEMQRLMQRIAELEKS